MTGREVVPLRRQGIVPISAAVRSGDLLFVSGIAAVEPATGALVAYGIKDQCDTVLRQLAALLEDCGSDLAGVLRIECFLASAEHFPAWNAAFARHFPADPPARTTLVCGFVLPGMLIEIQATCAVGA